MDVIKYLRTYFLWITWEIIKFDYNFMAGITYMLAWDSIVVDGMSSKSFYISKWLSGRTVVSWYLSFKIWRAIQLHIIWLAKSILCRREQLYLATFFDTWAFSKWFDISVVTVSINLWPKNLSIVKKPPENIIACLEVIA